MGCSSWLKRSSILHLRRRTGSCYRWLSCSDLFGRERSVLTRLALLSLGQCAALRCSRLRKFFSLFFPVLPCIPCLVACCTSRRLHGEERALRYYGGLSSRSRTLLPSALIVNGLERKKG